MSSSRIYRCLEMAACNVTERGKTVLRSSAAGMMIGALSGAALGGVSVGFHDLKLRDDGIRNFKSDHKNEYPEVCVTYKDGCHKCTRPGLDEPAFDFGLGYAKEEIAKVWPWILVGCTIGGAAVGLFAGAARGWKKELPVADVESQSSSYRAI
ncbi:MAG: hypothetical protein P4M12_08030 [Gammaproteobacteria bacterium]|nr:hypothetical protein [Gammaproteobacteria bacterium]